MIITDHKQQEESLLKSTVVQRQRPGWIEGLRWKLHSAATTCLLGIPSLVEMQVSLSKMMTFLRVWNYLVRSNIKGDYLEFGVYKGQSFNVALKTAKKAFKKKRLGRFFAFDSFLGLPKPHQQKDGAVFQEGEYVANEVNFRKNISRAARNCEIVTVPGFYSESLKSELIDRYQMKCAAFVNIDCDIYPSTLDVLHFVTPLLKTGSVLYFDDWYFSCGDMTLGEPGACFEWLRENPSISLIDFGEVATMGKLFIVNRHASSEKVLT